MTDIAALDRIQLSRVHRSAVYRAVVGSWAHPVLLACSGGGDSVALLVAASVAREKGRVGPVVAVHVDHSARPESADEGRFVAGLAVHLRVPFVSLALSPSVRSASGGVEARLREQRYGVIALAAGRLGIGAVVTGHTLNDQIETVLLRLLSGSSTLAALGMRESQRLDTSHGQIEVIRPLLDLSRAQLRDLLADAGVPYVTDPTNLDLGFRRNRLRHRVIPELEALDPGFGRALLRTVTQASRDAELAEALAARAFERRVQLSLSGCEIDRQFVRDGEPAITSRVLLRAIARLAPRNNREVTYERIEAVRTAASGRTGAVIELPYGIVARIERVAVIISKREGAGGE